MKYSTLISAATLVWLGMSASGCTNNPASAGGTSEVAGTEQDLIAGEYCYAFVDPTLDLSMVMEYDGKSEVSGTMYGDIHDTVESYFASYVTTFSGRREGKNLKVETKSEIEGDVQTAEATWPWDGKTLLEGRHTMQQVDCEPSPEK